jgi:hypothetical protein
MQISSPILEARWIEGIEGKPPRWYCGLRSCTHWLAEYWEYVSTPWYDGDRLFHVLLLPAGFTKREFGRRVICAQTKRAGHKLEVNRHQRDSLRALEDESLSHSDTYTKIKQKLKAEKAVAGRLVILGTEQEYLNYQRHCVPLPALVQCSNCKRLSVIRKVCDGQTEIDAHKRALFEEACEAIADAVTAEPLEKAK